MENQVEICHRYALLIGVRDYVDISFRKLPQTVHDVRELEKVLTRYGYHIRTLHCDQSGTDQKPTKANICAELENIASMTDQGDLLLVHFGGHGYLEGKNRAYLIPSDGRKSALKESAIDLKNFKKKIIKAGAQAKIMFLDACHSGIGRGAIGMSIDFERLIFLQANGTATLAACRRIEVAYNHDITPHGVFTYFLLRGLNGAAARKSQKYITFDDLKDYVTYEVKSWAYKKGLKQWPNANTQLVGDPPLVELPYLTSHPHLEEKELNPLSKQIVFTFPRKGDTIDNRADFIVSMQIDNFDESGFHWVAIASVTGHDASWKRVLQLYKKSKGTGDNEDEDKYDLVKLISKWKNLLFWPKFFIHESPYEGHVYDGGENPMHGLEPQPMILLIIKADDRLHEYFKNWLREGPSKGFPGIKASILNENMILTRCEIFFS